MQFPDWTAQECVAWFKRRAAQAEYLLAEATCEALKCGFGKLAHLVGWGNARDTNALWEVTHRKRANRIVEQEPAEDRELAETDVVAAMTELIQGRSIGAGHIARSVHQHKDDALSVPAGGAARMQPTAVMQRTAKPEPR